MKKIFTLSLALLCLSVISFSQQKKDTKIYVTTTDTTNLLNRAALYLYENGFTLDQKDEQVKFLASREKKVDMFGSMKINVLIKGTVMIITGTYAFDVKSSFKEERVFEPVFYGGAKGNLNMKCWDELMKLAKSIGSEISYSKQ